MTIMAGKHQSHSHYPKPRVVSVGELMGRPFDEEPVVIAARERAGSQVRFGNTEHGMTWKPTIGDPLRYLRRPLPEPHPDPGEVRAVKTRKGNVYKLKETGNRRGARAT